ncbi:MAG: siderophore-interacting protein [Actinomycetota bacterium]
MYGEVREAKRLSPSMVRIVLGGGDLDEFDSTPWTDQYINAHFVPAGAPYTVPFDPNEARETGDDFRPRPRRYTVRSWDEDAKELTIDFVAHGAEGYAGPWAQRAVPGDRLQFQGPGGSYAPNPEAAWHLFVGDESALPAIAASLEKVPAGARCVVRIVVDGPDDELPLDSPGELDVVWLHRRGAEDPPALLTDAVAALDFAPGPIDLFVHGEAGEVRDVRAHLIKVREVEVKGASISPYWRRNHTDEAWREVKRDFIAEMSKDG